MLTQNEIVQLFTNDAMLFRETEGQFNPYLPNGPVAPLHRQPKLCALLLLNAILPETSVFAGAGDDVLFLSYRPKELHNRITIEQVRVLRRCGVTYSETTGHLVMAF